MNTKRNGSSLICSPSEKLQKPNNFSIVPALHTVLQEMNKSSIMLENHVCLEQVFLLIRCDVCLPAHVCSYGHAHTDTHTLSTFKRPGIKFKNV